MRWALIGFQILQAIPVAVEAIERIKAAWKGSEKQDAAVEVVKTMVKVDGLPPEVETAVRQGIDAASSRSWTSV